MEPTLLTIDEARSILRVGRNVMYQLIKQGGLSYILVGKQIRIPREALYKWIESKMFVS
ncbi:helix-turn-helix domain-containing protein [Paenibacillus odorifer]|uniref:helix-turn-helix domain-containing protein n=1 Tax=Paenibacillus odorifer TaxID=189426 RepID=UPI0009D736F8|nr:helix-turn-helix domain-containing protein [Paenibacillus odorifer]